MGMHGDLSADRPAVPPHIVPIGMIVLVHPRFDVFQQFKGCALLFRRQIKNGFRVADRSYPTALCSSTKSCPGATAWSSFESFSTVGTDVPRS